MSPDRALDHACNFLATHPRTTAAVLIALNPGRGTDGWEAFAMKQYTLDDDIHPIINGKLPLPNVEDIDPLGFLNNLASVGHGWLPKWGYSSIDGQKQWTQFFLSSGQGGGLTGEGYAVRYGKSWPKPEPRVMRFAICKHEKVDGVGANHSRGWHPGSCKHCGLDMSVDSGD